HHPVDDAHQRHRLDAGVRPVLHHDVGRPAWADVHGRLLDLSKLFRVVQTRLRRGAVDRADPHHPRLFDAADHPDREERGEMTSAALAPDAPAIAARRPRRLAPTAYLTAAISIAVIAVMGAPIVLSTLASIKTAADASASPPHYLPSALSFENYAKVFRYQSGLATYVGNSALVAFTVIASCLAIAAPAGYGLARVAMRGKEIAFLVLLAPIMIPYQAILTPLYLDLAKIGLVNTHLGLAIVHTILQLPFSIYLM